MVFGVRSFGGVSGWVASLTEETPLAGCQPSTWTLSALGASLFKVSLNSPGNM